MSITRNVLKNTFFITFSSIATKIIAFLVAICLARHLGVEYFGKYNFVITYLMMFGFVASFGLEPVVIRETSRDPSLIDKIMDNSILIRFVTSVIAILLAIIFIKIMKFPADATFYVILTSGVLLFQGLSSLVESLFQSQLKMEYTAVSWILSKIIFGLLVLLVILQEGGLIGIFLAYFASEVSRTFISFIYSKKFSNFSFNLEIKVCKNLVKESLPFVLGYGLFVLYNRFDILMLSKMQGDLAVGFYSAAYKLTEPLLFLPSALATTLMPVMANLFVRDKDKLNYTYNLGTKYIFMLMLPITIGGFLLSDEIISIIYKQAFINSSLVFKILTVTIIFNSLNSIQTALLMSTNKQQLNNLSVSICAALNIILNFILIPKYSYVGAGVATLISLVCLYLLGFYFIHKHFAIQPFNKEFVKSMAATIAMGFLIMKINLHLVHLVVFGGIVYTILIFSLNGFNKTDIEVFKKLKKS